VRSFETTLNRPLRFRREFLEKVWGGGRLGRVLGIELPSETVGETWELADRDDVDSALEPADSGDAESRTLGGLVRTARAELLGSAAATPAGRFPLLVKYIDARAALSVQVHPDDAAAARVGGGAEGKTEAWYVLAAEPDAVVYCGLRPDVDAAAFERAARAGRDVVPLLVSWNVRAGDCLLVPGGTVHAIGGGVTLLEVQQNSDTTYRIYDWGRPRPIHVDEALASIAFGRPPAPPAVASWSEAGDGLRVAELARCDHFALRLLEVGEDVALATDGRFRIYVAVDGAGTIATAASERPLPVRRGDTWLVPAAAGPHALAPDGGRLTLVEVSTGGRS